MKRNILIAIVLALSLLLTAVVVPVQANSATITLLNPPAGVLNLHVGESYTFNIAIDSDTRFIQAISLIDQFYPERGLRDQGADVIVRQTSGMLHMTIKAVSSTAKLPNGISPITLVVGVRYGGGQVVSQFFPINVTVS